MRNGSHDSDGDSDDDRGVPNVQPAQPAAGIPPVVMEPAQGDEGAAPPVGAALIPAQVVPEEPLPALPDAAAELIVAAPNIAQVVAAPDVAQVMPDAPLPALPDAAARRIREHDQARVQVLQRSIDQLQTEVDEMRRELQIQRGQRGENLGELQAFWVRCMTRGSALVWVGNSSFEVVPEIDVDVIRANINGKFEPLIDLEVVSDVIRRKYGVVRDMETGYFVWRR